MSHYAKKFFSVLLAATALLAPAAGLCAEAKKPNIIFIMADDIGWLNIGAYNQGLMPVLTQHFVYSEPNNTTIAATKTDKGSYFSWWSIKLRYHF